MHPQPSEDMYAAARADQALNYPIAYRNVVDCVIPTAVGIKKGGNPSGYHLNTFR